MMQRKANLAPESTAERTALWRALHVQIDAAPYVFEDWVGLRLLAPGAEWRRRPDMDPDFTKTFRASMVARARFVEDLVIEQADRGVAQYVILGAGLDTFAQRRTDVACRMRIFEVDQSAPQEWKRQRLTALGYGIPEWLRFVPVDFEAGGSVWQALAEAGFDAKQSAIIASTGVSMYLTKEATLATFRQVAALAPGSTLAMTFMLPLYLMPPDVRLQLGQALEGARASGTPFISLFAPEEIMAMARGAGFQDVRHVPPSALAQRYFTNRKDGLQLSCAEEFLVAKTYSG